MIFNITRHPLHFLFFIIYLITVNSFIYLFNLFVCLYIYIYIYVCVCLCVCVCVYVCVDVLYYYHLLTITT